MSTAITSYLLKLSFRPTITTTLAGVDKDFDVKELCYVVVCVVETSVALFTPPLKIFLGLPPPSEILRRAD